MQIQVRSAILQCGSEVKFLPGYIEDIAHRTAQESLVYPWVTQNKGPEFAGIPTCATIGLGFSDKGMRRVQWLVMLIEQIMYLFGRRARSPVEFFRLLNGNVLKVSPPCMLTYSFKKARFVSDDLVRLEEVHPVAILEVKRQAEAAAK